MTVLSGLVADSTIGVDGDFFFKVDSGEVFEKVDGVWLFVRNIKPTGAKDEAAVLYGHGVPT